MGHLVLQAHLFQDGSENTTILKAHKNIRAETIS